MYVLVLYNVCMHALLLTLVCYFEIFSLSEYEFHPTNDKCHVCIPHTFMYKVLVVVLCYVLRETIFASKKKL